MKTFIKSILLLVVFINTILVASQDTPTKEEIAKLYVATFNRAPESSGLDYWVSESGLTLSHIAQSFFDQPETKLLYPSNVSNEEFVKAVYQNLFNRDPDVGGLQYWQNELDNGNYSRDIFIQTVINGAQDTQEFGLDKTTLDNKTEVGLYFADQNITDIDEAKNIMSDVSSDYTSVTKTLNNIIAYSLTQTSYLMNLTQWDIYGTSYIDNGSTLIIGDNIGLDYDDVDADKNYWNFLADGSTQYDYDVIVSKESFTPPISFKFSGTISQSDLGYNEIGLAYKDDTPDQPPLGDKLVEFVSRWENSTALDLYINSKGYINASEELIPLYFKNSYLSGNFEIRWDGEIVTLYFNSKKIYEEPLVYTEGKEVVAFFKSYERQFDILDISIENYMQENTTDTAIQEETITFNNLTYKTIVSPTTNRVWLDRNLGAIQVCQSLEDTQCYGDYYQWGRDSDGHEKKDSQTTSTQASSLTPNSSEFIIGSYDWTTADEDGSLRSTNYNPCPSGYKVPTMEEFSAENLSSSNDAFDKLKLTNSGFRTDSTGEVVGINEHGYYWTTTVDENNNVQQLDLYINYALIFPTVRKAEGDHIRCIKSNSL